MRMSTGERIAPKYWNPVKGRPRSTAPDVDDLNAYLDSLDQTVRQAHLRLRSSAQVITPAMLRDEIHRTIRNRSGRSNLVGWIQEYATLPQATIALKRNYNATLEILRKYPGAKDFGDINEAWFIRFTNWMAAYRDEKTLPDGYKANYIHKTVRYIKEFLNEALRAGATDKAGWKEMRYRATVEDVDSIYLSMDELMQIHHAKLPDHLRRTADRFLIGAFTALRYSDFSALTPDAVRDGMIQVRTVKTGQIIAVPVHPVVAEIFARYGGKLPRSITNQKMNKQLKELGRLAGITMPVQITETRGGRAVTRKVDKCELMTTHTARRSAATNMYLSGIPSISIMKITGHRTEKSFMKYIRITQAENAGMISTNRFFSTGR